MFGDLMKKSKKVSARKFLGTDTNSYVQWQVDHDGDTRISIHNGRHTIHFGEWISGVDDKDAIAFDKRMGVLVDEINAMRKAVKSKKK
jgi:hypothetical protein